jgi:hypothetical protein
MRGETFAQSDTAAKIEEDTLSLPKPKPKEPVPESLNAGQDAEGFTRLAKKPVYCEPLACTRRA